MNHELFSWFPRLFTSCWDKTLFKICGRNRITLQLQRISQSESGRWIHAPSIRISIRGTFKHDKKSHYYVLFPDEKCLIYFDNNIGWEDMYNMGCSGSDYHLNSKDEWFSIGLSKNNGVKIELNRSQIVPVTSQSIKTDLLLGLKTDSTTYTFEFNTKKYCSQWRKELIKVIGPSKL